MQTAANTQVPQSIGTTCVLEVAGSKKPNIHLGELKIVKGEYLLCRSLNFTRAATESHLCNMLLTSPNLIEEVTAVLVSTEKKPELSVNLTLC